MRLASLFQKATVDAMQLASLALCAGLVCQLLYHGVESVDWVKRN